MNLATKVLDETSALEKSYEIWRTDRLRFTEGGPEDEQRLTRVSFMMAEPEHVARCALLGISGDMGDLMVHAARSLPPYEFQPSLLPWPRAICVAEKPFLSVPHPATGEPVPVTALQWSDAFVASDLTQYVVVALAHVYGPDVLSAIEIATLDSGTRWENLRGTGETDDNTRNGELGRILCTLWLLLRQKIAVKRQEDACRGGRRRWGRTTGRPLPEVTVVELRKPLRLGDHHGVATPVDWRCRWIVDGHWRNQFHPSTGEYVPTWIAPYLKGPEDRPLVVTTKVHAWIR